MVRDDREGVHLEHALLHQIVDRIPSMLAYWDAEQRCRFANRAYERWFGVSPEALIGKHLRELLGPLYKLNLPYIEGALHGEPQEFEREIPDPAGGPARHSKANYLPDIADGVVRGFFVLVSDISDIKRAQLALRESEAKFSGMISRGVQRAHRLIQDLLDVTRIEAGALSIASHAVSAGRIARDALALLEMRASAASIELRLALDSELPELPEIWADDHRLLQVFENLIGNAIKFTPAGGRVTIGAQSRAGEVLFSVADTGAGIPAESLPRVFDRFWQAKRTERSGAGLGLPICKGLVEAHGGRIWVESMPGHGSTFYFTIPTAPHVAVSHGDAPAPRT